MANNVFANGRELACKSGQGKSIAAFPDVCFTPPQTQVTPPGVPIPYPNTGMATDTAKGTRKVKITNKEVSIQNKSNFKKTMGDEAGSASKKGVITSKNRGKQYFQMYSMNVKIEGSLSVRHLDIGTHNHMSLPGNTPPWPFLDTMAFGDMATQAKEDCKEEKEKEEEACSEGEGDARQYKSADACCADENCQNARKCMLTKYREKSKDPCCPGLTGHHLFPNSLLQGKRGDSGRNVTGLPSKPGGEPYNVNDGPCVCVQGHDQRTGEHGKIHTKTREKLEEVILTKPITYDDAMGRCADAHREVLTDDEGKPRCSKKCLESQMHSGLGTKPGESSVDIRQKNGSTSKGYTKFHGAT